MTGALVDAGSGRVLARRVVRATGPLRRTFGLLGRGALGADDGMWFDGCAAVHTVGMRFSIDVVFLDERGAVVRVDAGVAPWRAARCGGGVRTVVELAAGSCARLGIAAGTRLALQCASP
ncbi:MAG TPA: DUF192 domain-containing protein [Candidatus Acidoferrales bacterium]|nr:DUF192 domain-containing protein [Candidatus Acidoferrales bacterium]